VPYKISVKKIHPGPKKSDRLQETRNSLNVLYCEFLQSSLFRFQGAFGRDQATSPNLSAKCSPWFQGIQPLSDLSRTSATFRIIHCGKWLKPH